MEVLGRSRRCLGLATALVLLVLVCPAFADTLEGRVVEDHTGNPIVSAEAWAARVGRSARAVDREVAGRRVACRGAVEVDLPCTARKVDI